MGKLGVKKFKLPFALSFSKNVLLVSKSLHNLFCLLKFKNIKFLFLLFFSGKMRSGLKSSRLFFFSFGFGRQLRLSGHVLENRHFAIWDFG